MSALAKEIANNHAEPGSALAASGSAARPRAAGKFVFVGDVKFWIRGVTYGSFEDQPGGDGYPDDAVVDADFAAMRANGINTLRCYLAPPLRVLDAAQLHGLRVMVGLAWEQHVAFLEDAGQREAIVQRVREQARACAGHPALLCFAIGNEIPASIVRWHGRQRVERFLEQLYRAVKAEDSQALVTYVNFPTTEYLQLPFLDLICFNVYLEQQDRLDAYLARLQNLSGEKPLLMAEIGLDSRRHGLQRQAECLQWQLRSVFAAGCAGAFVFAWTDEWHRGGHPIEDWDFGLVTRLRQAKPALAAVRDRFSELPFDADIAWPSITVVVCSFNGARTIRDTLDGLQRLDYPRFDVIVVDDGSTDATAKIAAGYPVQLISTRNRGLSAARNTGWQHASGEIVAYIDDDAYPDPHWLQFLAWRFLGGDWVGVGGPNLAPPGDGPIADCVANAPGGPVQVLISDIEAEHVPGCNMAFRRDALAAIDGFDIRFRTAGDDVDICWRLQGNGGRIGFHASAMDWHHRRNSLAMYWRQQQGYGKAEALLEQKWPERYNGAGHLNWSGRLYGRGFALPIPSGRSRIYGGVWGVAAYQSLYQPAPLLLLALPLMPEWVLVIGALALLGLLGLSWPPLLWTLPLLVLALAAPIAQAALAASRAQFPVAAGSAGERATRWALTFAMHLMQPVARLIGRLRHGLTPWRRRIAAAPTGDIARRQTIWSEQWRSGAEWLLALESGIGSEAGSGVSRGSEFSDWDLALRGGTFGGARLRLAVEEHGAGRQLLRLAIDCSMPPAAAGALAALAVLAVLASFGGGWLAAIALAAAALMLAYLASRDGSAASAAMSAAIDGLRNASGPDSPRAPVP